jgi:hypothetical protein
LGARRLTAASPPSGCTPVIVVQQSAEPLAAFDLTGRAAGFGAGFDELVVQPLMISLGVIMKKPLGCGIPQRLLAEE